MNSSFRTETTLTPTELHGRDLINFGGRHEQGGTNRPTMETMSNALSQEHFRPSGTGNHGGGPLGYQVGPVGVIPSTSTNEGVGPSEARRLGTQGYGQASERGASDPLPGCDRLGQHPSALGLNAQVYGPTGYRADLIYGKIGTKIILYK